MSKISKCYVNWLCSEAGCRLALTDIRSIRFWHETYWRIWCDLVRTDSIEQSDLTVSRVTGAARAVYGNSSGAKQARLQHLFVRSSASGRHWDIGWECRWITAIFTIPIPQSPQIGGVNHCKPFPNGWFMTWFCPHHGGFFRPPVFFQRTAGSHQPQGLFAGALALVWRIPLFLLVFCQFSPWTSRVSSRLLYVNMLQPAIGNPNSRSFLRATHLLEWFNLLEWFLG